MRNVLILGFVSWGCVFLMCVMTACVPASDVPVYKDPSISVDTRVEDLLGRMTLEEKVGQMNMPCMYLNEMGRTIPERMENAKKYAAGQYVEGLGPAGGFFTLANQLLREGTRQQAEFYNELQKIALEQTRLGIPLNEIEEGTHGLMASGGTIFPEGPGIGSTWNMDLVHRIYTATAKEGRAIGVHQMFTLVVEPNRDPRLGRNEEGYSEDPYLCSRIAEQIVHGAQGNEIASPEHVVAGLCHYPGQSQPVSGLERGAMEISERTLREVFLPSWVAGIKKAGALGVMATYPAIDGVPAHSSDFLLTRILRDELGFEGIVTGEGGGITTLVYEQIATDQKSAGALALQAGVDVGISFEEGYMRPLIENVQEGTVSMDLIDRALRRILRLKFRQGLFENPYVDVDRAVATVHSQEHQDLALEAARESIVLLKNDNNLLPLSKSIKSIAVIGPNADHERNLLGDYIAHNVTQDIVTVLDGIRELAPANTKITHVKGCNVMGGDVNELQKAAQAARGADVAIVVVGENERRGTPGTNGEGRDIVSLDLTGMQEELVRAVHATGTPTVVVLINGRALSVRWIAEHVPAIVEGWLPGEKGGRAIAEVLFGGCNPSGRQPVTIPRHVGQLPCYYNYMPSKLHLLQGGYVDMSAEPLFQFGHGLSYTTFEYSDLQIAPGTISPDGDVQVSLKVRNSGSREGVEVVQLYIDDVISSVSTPVMELQGFEKITLAPGEEKTVTFELTPEHLHMLDRRMQWVVEPGTFNVMIGASSKDIRLKGTFEVVK